MAAIEPSDSERAILREARAWAAAHQVDCIGAGDPDYDARRVVYNRLHDPFPIALLAPRRVEHVQACLRFACQLGVPLAIRGGGHHVAGFGSCTGGVVLDLNNLRAVSLAADGTASVEGGARLLDVDGALCPLGRVVPTGTVSDTGIGGLALGGGIGWLIGRHGLTCDNLVGADVALADGSVVRAEDPGHGDLLWALRGGGGGFGVVTRFRFRSHPLATCLVGSTLVTQKLRAVLGRLIDFLSDECPEALTVAPVLRRDESGNVTLAVDFCWSGAQDERQLARFERAVGQKLNPSRDLDFAGWQRVADDSFREPLRGYWKACYLPALSNANIDALLAAVESSPSRSAPVLIEHLHGAFSRTDISSSAFPLRDARFGALFCARWAAPEDDERCIAWSREAARGLDPAGASGAYSNYSLGDDGRVQRDFARDSALAERLRRTKHAYDPAGVFRTNHHAARLLKAPSSQPSYRGTDNASQR